MTIDSEPDVIINSSINLDMFLDIENDSISLEIVDNDTMEHYKTIMLQDMIDWFVEKRLDPLTDEKSERIKMLNALETFLTRNAAIIRTIVIKELKS